MMTNAHVLLAALMLAAGILGGATNHISRNDAEEDGYPTLVSWMANIFLSTIAAFITPLFLSLAKSSILDQIIANYEANKSVGGDLFVFFGFCLLAACLARFFVPRFTAAVMGRPKGDAPKVER